MRQITIAMLIIVFGTLGTFALERKMTSIPEWGWNVISVLCVFAGVVIASLSDPIYLKLKDPTNNPISSTIFVSVAIGVIAGAIWWFLVIPNMEMPKKEPPKAGAEQAQKEEEHLETPKIKSLHDLFLEDFNETKMLSDFHFLRKAKEHIQ